MTGEQSDLIAWQLMGRSSTEELIYYYFIAIKIINN